MADILIFPYSARPSRRAGPADVYQISGWLPQTRYEARRRFFRNFFGASTTALLLVCPVQPFVNKEEYEYYHVAQK